ncbi:high-affinity nicotinic acid transporter-like protein [Penicillium atrosanguineum]|uniref:High-affinity nicotinic acid transporter-like protein n=1 Tax=Penicillium atrosanguineum TaxID=1132637 RepID=A0A9W9U664_9EURO|nr:high-affinity nicotinic acid transporter-like protein [Penicillium atrosanguineum]
MNIAQMKHETTKVPVVDTKVSNDNASEIASFTIYIDPEKESAALRKFDVYLLPVSVVFLVLSALDRNNLGNARVFGFDKDIGLKGDEFGNITLLSSLCTIVFEVPWVLAVKRFGANKSLGTALILWSCCTLGTAFIQNYGQAIAVRMLLNTFEAGLAQSFAYLFSTIYPRERIGKRIMTTNLAMCISGAFGGLFAYSVQTMGNQRGLAAWRWLFIIEFCITVLVGGIGWILLPTSAEKAWFLSEEEQKTMRLKRQRDFVHRGEDNFDPKWVKFALTDPFIWFLGTGFFTSSVAINGFVNYLTVPIYVLGAISLITQVYYSDKLNKRGVFIVGSCIPVAVGYLICIFTANTVAGYIGMFVLVIAVTWISTNLSPDSKRAIGMPLAYSIGNLSSLVASQLYPSQQGPRYIIGNATSAGLSLVAGVLYAGCWLLLKRRNAQKAKLLAEGATTNGLEGDMSLDSMYIL